MTTLDADTAPQDDVLWAYTDDGQYPDFAARGRPPTLAEILSAASPRDDDIGLAATGELESCIVAAIHDAIGELLGGADRVRVSSASLKRSGDPLGLTDGDGNTADAPETNAPTPERVAARGAFEHVSVNINAGRDKGSEVWRHVPLVEAMIRRGQIANDDGPAFVEAARQFYRDYVQGHTGRSITARYGELTSGGGTPASQQTVKCYTDRHGQTFEAPGPEDRRHDAHTRWWNACRAIGITKCQVTGKPHPSQTLHWMLVLVCEDYSVANERTPSLEDAGRAYLGYKSPVQASAAGAALIKAGLERLVEHYGVGR